MDIKQKLAAVLVPGLMMASAFAIDTSNLNNTGAELGGFLTNMAPGLESFIFKIGLAVMILGLIGGIIFVVRKVATGFGDVMK